MKNAFKIFIKTIFVFVLPIITTISVVYFLSGDSVYVQSYLTWIILISLVLISYLNAVFYHTFMSKTKILPSVSGSFVPGIAIGIIVDRHQKGYKILVILPFYSIELGG
jgi:hypothetical protein